jgi:transcriptional regulator GlxA family with amidase domain
MWVVVLRLSPAPTLVPSAQPAHCLVGAATARAMVAVCEQLDGVGSSAVLNAGLSYLWETAQADLAKAASGCATLNVHPAVAATARRVRERPELELQDLAAAANMSAGRLGRLFKRQMGVALSTYRNRLRLDRAREQLQSPSVSTLQAALASGFGSYAQFYRVFRDETGLSPRQALARRRP